MLEDLEERRREVVSSTEEIVREAREARMGAGKGKAKEVEEAPTRKDDFRQDLLSSLTIRENEPILTAVPLPPSLDSAVHDFERPRRPEPPSSSSSSKPSRSPRFPASPAPRSGSSSATTSSSGSSLLPFSTTRLSKTVLSSLSPPPTGLPPIRFLGAPRTVDDDSLPGFEGEEEESEEVRKMVEEGLRERNEARQRGEIR